MWSCPRLQFIAKFQTSFRFFIISRPFRKPSSLGIAGLGELRPIIAHQSREFLIVVMRLPASPIGIADKHHFFAMKCAKRGERPTPNVREIVKICRLTVQRAYS